MLLNDSKTLNPCQSRILLFKVRIERKNLLPSHIQLNKNWIKLICKLTVKFEKLDFSALFCAQNRKTHDQRGF
jgi:hypothetical protein